MLADLAKRAFIADGCFLDKHVSSGLCTAFFDDKMHRKSNTCYDVHSLPLSMLSRRDDFSMLLGADFYRFDMPCTRRTFKGSEHCCRVLNSRCVGTSLQAIVLSTRFMFGDVTLMARRER